MRRLAVVVTGVALVAGGCAAAVKQPPAVDVTGYWRGTWSGYGIVDIPREERAEARLTQQGAHGHGELVLLGTGAAESVPLAVRRAGLAGSRVVFDVAGREVTVRHELGGALFVIDFTVEGDRMVGYVRDADPPVRIVLTRARPEPPRAAAPPAPVEPPPPAAPPPTAAEPPSVAAAPTAPPAEPEPPPPAARPAPREFVPVAELPPVYFDFDRADIRPDAARLLDAGAEWLRANADIVVLVAGHCDERGTNEYNLALGERRARAVRDYLIARGIAAERLTTVSYGEERPVCVEAGEACWARNRRVEFLVRPR